MKCLARVGALLLIAANLAACDGNRVVTEPGVSLQLASERAARLGGVHYRLHFDIPADEDQAIAARAVIGFDLADAQQPLQLDFAAPAASLLALRSNGAEVDYRFRDEHIVLPREALRAGRNEVEVEFVAGATSLNRNPEYLYSLLVPDRARTVFPLFDQPDIKARFELSLRLPAPWLAMSNAPVVEVSREGERVEYRFAPSAPISSYLFAFVAGRFESVTREVGGRQMTLFHRETDRARVARNLDAIFSLHGEAIAWLEEYTGIAYPFESFDFALIPGFPYGGMEHVGAIAYRASLLLLEESPPLTDLLNRASLIAHETAHMWFGNLVTMRWFDDVWTKEVFANFMADKMVNPTFPGVDHELNFLAKHYPDAYAVDRSEGANPIRQPLANLNQAGQLYGNIIYDKAPIMMRQLELIVGEEGLRDGLRQYLREFAYGNASWPQLIAILDERSERDLAAWSEVWVNTPGRPEFRLAAGQGERRLLQVDPQGRGRVWPQQFELLTLYPDSAVAETVLAAQAAVALPAQDPPAAPQAELFNADGKGYGLFPADGASLAAWDRLQGVQRGAALVNAYEQLLAGTGPAPQDYVEILLAIIAREQDPLLLELALRQLQFVTTSLVDDAWREAHGGTLEDQLWASMLAQPDASGTKLLFRYFSALAATPSRVQQLYRIWSRELDVPQLLLEEEDLASLAQLLAIRLPEKSAQIMARQIADTANPDRKRRLEFLAPSVAADAAQRDAFFESLAEPRNRRPESWVLEALGNLHHPSRLAQSQQYLLPSLQLLEEIQRTGDIFFPSGWLRATLGNYHDPAQAELVRQFLAERPGYNPQLRMKILQAADPLMRAAAIRAAPAGAQ